MAITKLMHMKESPDYAPKHLINAIDYILDVRHDGKKTDYGMYVGGNVGTEAQEIIDAFLDTKDFYGKQSGRQGYHFVISFAPGECDRDTCYQVAKEFCEKYLGDNYEYVFAVHNDKAHNHAHIIFNSVSRSNGLKYRYEKGDWQKYIQPVTDKICEEHGIMPLIYEEECKSMTYADWQYQRDNQKTNWKHILMADIDYAIDQASSKEDFFEKMKSLGWNVTRIGKRENKPDITFTLYDSDGKKHPKRLSNLPVGYRYEDIMIKLEGNKLEQPYYKKLGDILEKQAKPMMSNAAVLRNTESYRRMYQAVSYYKLPNPYAVPSSQVRTDMKRIEKLIEQCAYLKHHLEKETMSLQDKAERVEQQLHALYVKRKNLYQIREQYVEQEVYEDVLRYLKLESQLSDATEWGDKEEFIQDEMCEIEKNIPSVMLNNELEFRKVKYEIAALVKERRMVENILKSEKGIESNVKMNVEKRKPTV